MQNTQKNLVMLGVILVIVSILFIGGSYAYFSMFLKDNRPDENNGETNMSTDNIASATIVTDVPDGVGAFSETDIYPGHKEVLGLSVTARGVVGSKSYFQFKYNIEENELGKNVKVSVYESDKPISITKNYFACVKKSDLIENTQISKYYEACMEKEVGTLLQDTTLNGGSEELIIGKDIISITEENVDVTKYYYVVLEFINVDASQNEDMNLSLVGRVTVEATIPFEKEKKGELATTYITNLADKTDELVYDNTVDNNLRYIGANPSNYIDIGDRDSEGNVIPWRIIGVMNNVDDGSGTKETRLKVIRGEGIGEYSWDTSTSSVNNAYGINEWSEADLMKLLNPGYEEEGVGGSLYWNNQSGTCYNWSNNATTVCDFTSSGLSLDAKSVFGTTLWHTGSNGTEASYDNIITSKFYELEQSSNIGKICISGTYCTDTVNRTTTWVGTLGLMSPSDYGYATSGGTTTNRETCLSTNLHNWSKSGVSNCKTNDWLYNSSIYQLTLMPVAYSSCAGYVFLVNSAGHVEIYNASYNGLVRPVGYLLSSVRITGGDGSIDDIFTLSQEK